jgi:hypothetical protein
MNRAILMSNGKTRFYKLHVQKRIEANGSVSVHCESTLKPQLTHAGVPSKSDSGEIDLPWTRPLIMPKSKVKGKKYPDRLPVDRTAQIANRLRSKTKPSSPA